VYHFIQIDLCDLLATSRHTGGKVTAEADGLYNIEGDVGTNKLYQI
jgi:hypothetical protein